MTKRKYPELEQELCSVVNHFGGVLKHGESVAGTIRISAGDLELDAEVTIKLRRVLTRDDRDQHVAASMALLAKEGWRDRCACSVKNRSIWSISKKKDCGKPVVAAVVVKYSYLTPGERENMIKRGQNTDCFYTFKCAAHAYEAKEGTAVVILPQNELKAMRKRRDRERDERYARERQEEEQRSARTLVDATLGHNVIRDHDNTKTGGSK